MIDRGEKIYYLSDPYYLTERVKEPKEFFRYLSVQGFKDREIWNIFRAPAYIITGGRGTGKTLLGKFISYRYQQYIYDRLYNEKEYSEIIKMINEALSGKRFWGIYSKVDNPKYLYVKDEEKAREYSYILGTTLDLKIVEELCRSLKNLMNDYALSSYVKEYIGLNPNKIQTFVREYLEFIRKNFQISLNDVDSISDLHKEIQNLYDSYRDAWDNGLEKVRSFCILKFTGTFIKKLQEIKLINPNIRIIIIIDEIQWYEKLPHEFALRLLNEFIYKVAREPEFNNVNLILIGRTYGIKVKKCLTSDEIIERSRGLYGVLNLNKFWKDNKFTKYQQFLEDIFIKRWSKRDVNIDVTTTFQLWQNKNIVPDRSKLNLIYGNTLKKLIKDIGESKEVEQKTPFDQVAQELKCNDIKRKMFLLAIIIYLTRKNKIKQEIVFNEEFKNLISKYLSNKKLQNKYYRKIKWVVSTPIDRFFGWDCITKISYPYIANFLDMLKNIDGKEDLSKSLFKEIRKEVQYESILYSSKGFIEEVSSLIPNTEYLNILENLTTLLKVWQKDLSIIEFPIGVKINKEKISNEDLSMLDVAESYDLLSIKEDFKGDCLLIEPASPTLPYYRLCPFTDDYIELDNLQILKSKNKEYVRDYAERKFQIIKVSIRYPNAKKNKQKYFWEGD